MNVIFAVDQIDLIRRAVINNIILSYGGKVLAGQYTMASTGERVTEVSYLLDSELFEKLVGERVLPVEGQESFLYVTSCNKQYATLRYADGRTEALGSLHSVTKEEAHASPAFTFDPLTNTYWVTKPGNPDKEAPADRDARELWAAIDAVLDTYVFIPLGGYPSQELADLAAVRDKQRPKWLDA